MVCPWIPELLALTLKNRPIAPKIIVTAMLMTASRTVFECGGGAVSWVMPCLRVKTVILSLPKRLRPRTAPGNSKDAYSHTQGAIG